MGRVFSVTCETWRLTDDPQKVAPQTELVASRRSASDAADIARETAETFSRHGFHKPSASWWAAEEALFHRFVVHGGPRHGKTALIVATGLAGVVAAILVSRGRRAKATD